MLHAASAHLQGARAATRRYGLPPAAREPAEVRHRGDHPHRAAASARGGSPGGCGGGARQEGRGEKLHLVGGVHCDPGGLRPGLPSRHRAPQHVLHFEALHCDILWLKRAAGKSLVGANEGPSR